MWEGFCKSVVLLHIVKNHTRKAIRLNNVYRLAVFSSGFSSAVSLRLFVSAVSLRLFCFSSFTSAVSVQLFYFSFYVQFLVPVRLHRDLLLSQRAPFEFVSFVLFCLYFSSLPRSPLVTSRLIILLLRRTISVHLPEQRKRWGDAVSSPPPPLLPKDSGNSGVGVPLKTPIPKPRAIS